RQDVIDFIAQDAEEFSGMLEGAVRLQEEVCREVARGEVELVGIASESIHVFVVEQGDGVQRDLVCAIRLVPAETIAILWIEIVFRERIHYANRWREARRRPRLIVVIAARTRAGSSLPLEP